MLTFFIILTMSTYPNFKDAIKNGNTSLIKKYQKNKDNFCLQAGGKIFKKEVTKCINY
jgi:hypothetical protein